MDEKRELHVELWVKRSKVNLPATFWVHLFSARISDHILVSFIPTLYTDSGGWKKHARKVLWQTVIDQGQ